jgi:hypothetical protein
MALFLFITGQKEIAKKILISLALKKDNTILIESKSKHVLYLINNIEKEKLKQNEKNNKKEMLNQVENKEIKGNYKKEEL